MSALGSLLIFFILLFIDHLCFIFCLLTPHPFYSLQLWITYLLSLPVQIFPIFIPVNEVYYLKKTKTFCLENLHVTKQYLDMIYTKF